MKACTNICIFVHIEFLEECALCVCVFLGLEAAPALLYSGRLTNVRASC